MPSLAFAATLMSYFLSVTIYSPMSSHSEHATAALAAGSPLRLPAARSSHAIECADSPARAECGNAERLIRVYAASKSNVGPNG